MQPQLTPTEHAQLANRRAGGPPPAVLLAALVAGAALLKLLAATPVLALVALVGCTVGLAGARHDR